MPALHGTRMLFLDDSGAPSPNHASGAVVIGGFAIASTKVPALSRRITGAKARHFPERRDPSQWEIKSAGLIAPNAWKRQRNRALVQEVVRILQSLDCTTYTASINKARMHHEMATKTTLPMQIQRLVEHFAVECAHRREIGLVVMDRSDDRLDSHTSHCVASYVTSRRLPLHAVVYYVDSVTSQATQVADMTSAVRRRAIEGTPDMQALDNRLASLRVQRLSTKRTHADYPWTNRIAVI